MNQANKDHRWHVKKNGAYYRPKAEGYTDKPWMAGLFTYEEAWAYSHPNGDDGPRDGIEMVYSDIIFIGLGGWLEKVEVHQPGSPGYDITEKLKNWFFVTDAEEIIAYFRNMEDAFTFKLDYINGKLNK